MNTSEGIFLHQVVPGISVLGPGTRVVVWVQGCTLACKGCISPNLWKQDRESWVPSSQVADRILELLPGHDGITVSGGEPFQQAAGLAAMLERVREQSNVDVLIYSGYRLEEILRAGEDARWLLAAADILIDGRYMDSASEGGLWRGSANQRMYFLSEKGLKHRGASQASGSGALQLMNDPGGEIRIIGIPKKRHDVELRSRLAERGIELRKESLWPRQ